jgi:hypothetical protein
MEYDREKAVEEYQVLQFGSYIAYLQSNLRKKMEIYTDYMLHSTSIEQMKKFQGMTLAFENSLNLLDPEYEPEDTDNV